MLLETCIGYLLNNFTFFLINFIKKLKKSLYLLILMTYLNNKKTLSRGFLLKKINKLHLL